MCAALGVDLDEGDEVGDGVESDQHDESVSLGHGRDTDDFEEERGEGHSGEVTSKESKTLEADDVFRSLDCLALRQIINMLTEAVSPRCCDERRVN